MSESTNQPGQSQYRATRIWYEIVHSFYANVAPRKHWRNFRTYQDCFAASEAIDWLFGYLKSSPNFKAHTSITRQQAIQLLQIFLKEKIIEDVRASHEKYVFKPFSDDDRLYKFNTSHRLYQNRPNNTSTSNIKSNETETTNESLTSKQTNQTTDISTSLGTETETNTTQSLFNEKSVDTVEVKCDHLVNETTKQQQQSEHRVESDKENNSKPKVSSRHHHHHYHLSQKLENEIWSKAVHEMLESIVNKAVLNSIHTEVQHNSKKPRRSLNLNTDNLSDIELNLDELLYEGNVESTKNKTTGSFINHNCNHINKHGVVTETDDDFPAWLVKAMTTLLKWRQERNEFPRFEDVFAEINKYFNDMNEPLLTKDISRLLFQIMKIFLLPQYYVPNLVEANDEYAELECSVMHEKNTKIFENVMKNLSHLTSNQSFQFNEFVPAASHMFDEDEEEAHLVENAKLPIIPLDSNDSVYNPSCCEDCEIRHSILNNFINTSAIEFSEFVSSINDRDTRDQFDFKPSEDENLMEDEEPEVDVANADDDDEQYDEFDPDPDMFRLKLAEDKFSRLKLNSPFKPKKTHHKVFNRSIAKTFNEKRLQRNNSFRAAIGEMGTSLKMPSIVPHVSTIETTQKSPRIINNDQKSVKELLKKFDEPKQKSSLIDVSHSHDSSYLVKSCSMNSISNTANMTLTEDDESSKLTRMEAIRKRKLADAFNSLNRQHRLNTYNSLSNFGMTPSLPRNYSFDNQKIEHSFTNSTLPRLSMSSLKSYNDLCNVIMKSNTASLNNLTDDNLIEIKNRTNGSKYKSRLSNLSVNTLNSIILTTMNSNQTLKESYEKKKAFAKKLNLASEIESETLCFMISAFRMCALMLPPSNKRKLHLLLRFLYKLRCDHNSAKYLLSEHDAAGSPNYEDLNFIDSSIINSSNDFLNMSKPNDYSSFCLSSTTNQQQQRINSSLLQNSFSANKPKLDLKELDTKTKAVEKFIIKSFFKSIVCAQTSSSADEEEEHYLLGMKLIQILINHYPEVMRIPDELVKNVSISLTTIRQTKSMLHPNTKISLQQYDKQTAEISKQHLAELLNNILTDMSIKDEDKLQRLRKFKETHPHIYEEKYSTIKKALNILGLNNSAAFLVPSIDKPSKNYFLDDISNRRESTYIKKRTHMAKLTESAKKKSSSSSSSSSQSFQMNQTIMSFIQPSSSSSSSSIGLPKFFLNKLKKENNL